MSGDASLAFSYILFMLVVEKLKLVDFFDIKHFNSFFTLNTCKNILNILINFYMDLNNL